MSFQYLQEKIARFRDKRGGSIEGRIEHLLEEVTDLQRNPYDILSLADCYILLMAITEEAGFDMDEMEAAIEAKQSINEKQEWQEPDENGVTRRIKETNL